MADMKRTVRAAAAQIAPDLESADGTLARVLETIRSAARQGVELIVFPETFVPYYPYFSFIQPPVLQGPAHLQLMERAPTVPGPMTDAVAAAAREAGMVVVLGVNERDHGSLYNTQIVFDADGRLLLKRRKITPTYHERMVWGQGDGSGLVAVDTRVGRVGALACWEHYNPLARYALMAQGEQIHISTWPPIWPTKVPRAGGNYDNVAANRTRAAAHSFEAKAFTIVCAGFMDRAMRDFLVDRDASVADVLDETPRAASMLVDPTGAQVGDMLQAEEGILSGELDLAACVEPKQFHDVVGYYNRFDVFELKVTRERTRAAQFLDHDLPGPIPLADDDAGQP